MFNDPQFIENMAVERQDEKAEEKIANYDMKQKEHSGTGELKKVQLDFSTMKMDLKKWYPRDLCYELMVPKELLRKNEGLKKVHKLVD